MHARWAIVAVIAVLLSCTNERPATSESENLGYFNKDAYDVRQYAPAGQPAALAEVAVTVAKLPVISRPDATSMIIRTATALIEVDSLEAAVASLKQLAA